MNLDRGLPANVEVERSILGAILLDNNLSMDAAERLSPDDFSMDANRRIYAAMLLVTGAGRPIDIATMQEQLNSTRDLEDVGGVAYLAALTDGVPRRESIEHYINIVKDKSSLRRLIHTCNSAMERACSGEEKADDLLPAVQEQLVSISAEDDRDFRHVSETTNALLGRFERELQRKEEILGFPLGIDCIDRSTGGLQDGELMLIAGRSGSGKTHALIQATLTNGRMGTKVDVFSLEMKEWQWNFRMWGHEGHIPTSLLRDKRQMSPEQRREFKAAALRVAEMPIRINDASAMSTDKMLAKAALAVRRNKTELIVVDYGQKLTALGKEENERSAKQAQALCKLAKDYCPVICAVQLSKAPEHNVNKWPNMEDIRGSSQWTNDAHIIGMIFRPRDEKNTKLTLNQDKFILEKMRESEGLRVEPVMMTPWADWVARYEGPDIQ